MRTIIALLSFGIVFSLFSLSGSVGATQSTVSGEKKIQVKSTESAEVKKWKAEKVKLTIALNTTRENLQKINREIATAQAQIANRKKYNYETKTLEKRIENLNISKKKNEATIAELAKKIATLDRYIAQGKK